MLIRSRSRTTRWNLFFHYASMVLMMVSGIVLVPLYLNYIPLKLYGAWLASGNVLMWLTAIDPGLSSLLQQRVGTAYGKGDLVSVGLFSTSGLLISALISLLLALAGIMISGVFIGWLNVPLGVDTVVLRHAFLIAVLGSVLSLFSYSVTSVNQGLQSSLGIGLIYVAVHTLDIILVVALLLFGFGLMALAYSILFRGVGLLVGNAVYMLLRFRREAIAFSVSCSSAAELLRLTPFTFFSRASGLLASNLDAFLVGRFLGVEWVPVLMLTRKVFDLCRGLIERPAIAFMPAVSHLAGAGDMVKMKTVLSRLMRIETWMLMLAASGLLCFNDDFVSLWVGHQFFAGHAVNTILCISLIMAVCVFALSNLSMALGDIKRNSMALVLQSLVAIILMYVGVKYIGLVGVVLAPVVAMSLIGFWFYSKLFSELVRLDPADRKLLRREFLLSFAVALALAVIFMSVNVAAWGAFFGLVVIYVLLYFAVLCTISRSFRGEVTGLWNKFLIVGNRHPA